jgi:hypothetical protein
MFFCNLSQLYRKIGRRYRRFEADAGIFREDIQDAPGWEIQGKYREIRRRWR